MKANKPQFITLILMMSFASVNAVMFTPALPDIAQYFGITEDIAQYTLSLFLIGYAIGQLIYGPLASRFGRIQTLYIGIILQILASLACAFSGLFDSFLMLVISRFLVALGSGVGLKMTFTIVNETEEPTQASRKISYLMLTFAITPGLGVALGGFLNNSYGWMSCFIAGAIHGLVLLFFISRLPKMNCILDTQALSWSHLKRAYALQFRNRTLILGALLMGMSTCIVYAFAAIAPFIAINIMKMNSNDYGLANIIPSIGLVIGSLSCAKLVIKHPIKSLIKYGVLICTLGVVMMGLLMILELPAILSLFVPMIIIYIGASYILPTASSFALSKVEDKAHGSAVLNFINMGMATVLVLSLGELTITPMVLPAAFICICCAMGLIGYRLLKSSN